MSKTGNITVELTKDFDYSQTNQGHTLRTVTDWQIDLGNYCNGRCVFCSPSSSSSLATEFKKIEINTLQYDLYRRP